MATSHQRRPDGKAPDPKALVKPDAELRAQLEKIDAQKKALEQRGEKTDAIDADLAAKLQPSMGNAALAGLLNRATDTASADAGELALEEKKDEEKEEEGEEKEAGEVEHVLPSFSTGGGGGGGQPPWAMARELGGDDDAAAETLDEAAPRWRPMPVLPDPDEDDDAELEEVDGEDAPADPDLVDLRAATHALGDAPWRPTVLARGLRHARRLARRDFGPEALVDADGLDHPLGRARAMLRFVARHGDGLDAVLLARAAVGAGEAAFAPEAGFAGATARSLALVECVLVSLPPRWPALLDVAVDPRARALVENVAESVAEGGGLSATALLEAVLGARVEPADVDLVLSGHPAAVAALTTVARLEPLPLLDLWTPPERFTRVASREDRAVDALDAVLARFTGGSEPEEDTLVAADISVLFQGMNQLLAAIGGALVEIAAAGIAIAPHVPLPAVVGVLAPAESALRRAARRVYTAGEALERLVGADDLEQVRALSAEALAVRSTVDVARQGAIASLATLLIDSEPAPPELPELYARAEAEALSGRTATARGLLDAAVVASPPELEGRVVLGAAGLLSRLGLPDDGRLAEAADRLGAGVLGVGARSLAAGAALARGEWRAAEAAGAEGGRVGRDQGLVYAVADAACTVASARAHGGGDWRAPLRDAAEWLREREEGGALNLLKARWGELQG